MTIDISDISANGGLKDSWRLLSGTFEVAEQLVQLSFWHQVAAEAGEAGAAGEADAEAAASSSTKCCQFH